MAYTGGHRIDAARWIGVNAIAVDFTADDDGLCRQLYAGRELIGVTDNPLDRTVVGQLVQSEWPPLLSLVAVETSNRLTEYGDTFGVGPWNRAKFVVSVASMPADAQRLELTGGTEPGGAVDDTNILATRILEGDGTYTLLSDPLPGNGTWNFEVTPYDSRMEGGNAGTALAGSVAILSMPPDVVLQDDGLRLFDVSIAGQTLNLSVVLP